jgi:hypothetical protein
MTGFLMGFFSRRPATYVLCDVGLFVAFGMGRFVGLGPSTSVRVALPGKE